MTRMISGAPVVNRRMSELTGLCVTSTPVFLTDA